MVDIQNWLHAETDFAANGYDGSGRNPASVITPRRHALCFTAVHAVNHYRYRAFKRADRMTGGLVQTLGEITGSSTAINTRRTPEIEPLENPTAIEAYLLATQPMSIIDVHAAKPENSFDLCIGTGPGEITPHQQWLVNELTKLAQTHHLLCDLNHENYSARIAPAMTRRLKEQQVSQIIQVEINASVLNGGKKNLKTTHMLQVFALLAARINSAV